MEKWGQMIWFSKLETLLKSSIKVYKLSKLYKFISLTDQPLAILWLERSLIFQHCTPIYGQIPDKKYRESFQSHHSLQDYISYISYVTL